MKVFYAPGLKLWTLGSSFGPIAHANTGTWRDGFFIQPKVRIEGGVLNGVGYGMMPQQVRRHDGRDFRGCGNAAVCRVGEFESAPGGDFVVTTGLPCPPLCWSEGAHMMAPRQTLGAVARRSQQQRWCPGGIASQSRLVSIQNGLSFQGSIFKPSMHSEQAPPKPPQGPALPADLHSSRTTRSEVENRAVSAGEITDRQFQELGEPAMQVGPGPFVPAQRTTRHRRGGDRAGRARAATGRQPPAPAASLGAESTACWSELI
jgi:hypothetical protein